MKRYMWIAAVVIILSLSWLAVAHEKHPSVINLETGNQSRLKDIVPDLERSRVVLVGEHHNNSSHHRAQLRVIQVLRESGAKVAIGLEMFRMDSQDALDRWVDGKISSDEFQQIYYSNWNFPWEAYSMIFEYARQNRIPMVGLNVPRDITRKVSRQGFQSLSKAQRGELPEVTCRVDKEYMDYIKESYGAHAHGKLNFTYFCEAQLVWDNAMAVNTLAYLNANPDAVVVILTGTGHAQKAAIPRQIRQRSDVPYTVILPEVPGMVDSQTVSTKNADYLLTELD
jgi:uncharacterized iron-regulated protein